MSGLIDFDVEHLNTKETVNSITKLQTYAKATTQLNQ